MGMSPEAALKQIEATTIVAGMRGNFPPSVAVQIAKTLFEEGISVFELMMNSVEPLEAMRAIKQALGDAVCVGMGTMLDVAQVQPVIDAGADFVVSPAFQPEIVRAVQAQNVLMAPGVITPSEAVQAWALGVPLLKLFPIGALGEEYFRAMFGPLNHMKFMCNGAIDDQNSAALIKAGAVAVGIGGWLVGDGSWTESRLRSRARVLRNAITVARGGTPVYEA